VTLIEIV